MNDDQLQAWLDQHGGEVGRKDNEREVDDTTINPNTGLPNKKKTVDSTTITAKDGATLTLRRSPDGSGATYQVIENTPARAQAAQSQASAPGGKPFIDDGPDARENGRRWGWNDQTRLYDRDLGPSPTAQEIIRNRSLPADQDPRAETDAERAQRAKETIARQDREAERNKPGAPTLKPDGKGGTIAVQTMPDGSIKTTPLPGVPSDKPTPERVTVNGTVYERDPQTGQYRPAQGLPTTGAAEPAGAPPLRVRLGEVTSDLQTYAEFLNTKVQEWQRTGGKSGLSPEQADNLLKKRRELAQTAINEQTTLTNIQRDIYGDEIGQRRDDIGETASRRSAAGQTFANALSTFGDASKLGRGAGPAYAEAILATLDLGRANAQNWGGMREYDRVELPPYLAQLRNRVPSYGADPAPAPAVSASAAAAPPPVTPERAAEIRQNPVFRPAAPVGAAPVGASPAAAAPVAAPSAAPAVAPPVPVLPIYDQGGAYNPGRANATGMPAGSDIPPPPAPVQPGSGAGGNVQMAPPPPWVDQARYGQQYNPDPILSKLVGDPDMPTDVVLEAYRDLYQQKPRLPARGGFAV